MDRIDGRRRGRPRQAAGNQYCRAELSSPTPAPEDIGFVYAGQSAEVKVETFQFTKYDTIDGEVEHVSNDAVSDDKLGLVYLAQVKLAATTMWVEKKLVNLTPGMAVTVEVNMGQRRLIEFLLNPLLRYKDESVRER